MIFEVFERYCLLGCFFLGFWDVDQSNGWKVFFIFFYVWLIFFWGYKLNQYFILIFFCDYRKKVNYLVMEQFLIIFVQILRWLGLSMGEVINVGELLFELSFYGFFLVQWLIIGSCDWNVIGLIVV